MSNLMDIFDADICKSGTASPPEEPYVPIGVKGLIAASGKLLAVNRGLSGTDDRDALEFKRVMTTDKLLKERIKMDASKMRGKLIRVCSRRKSLQGIMPFAFDGDVEGLLVGNPLSSPLEEINPMHLVEQSRRITQMGPGGIGSDNAVTPAMQALSSTQFGFICPLSGPECFNAASEVYTKRGWVMWFNVFDDDEFACREGRKMVFHKADRVIREEYIGHMIVAARNRILMCVTPNHRIIGSRGYKEKLGEHAREAQQIYGTYMQIPTYPNLSGGYRHTYATLKDDSWSETDYAGIVYCATVPGGALYVRGSASTKGYWSGNSERAGIDVRLAHGAKIGSDGKIYQKFRNVKTGDFHWLSPEDTAGAVVKIPD